MYYKRNEKLQNLLHRKVNCENTASIVEIFVQTIKTINLYNALDAYMTLHVISVWSVKNKQAREFPSITAKIKKVMYTLYKEIRWESDKKGYLTPSMVFVHFGAPFSLKEIYGMLEDDQDSFCELIVQRVNRFNSLLSE